MDTQITDSLAISAISVYLIQALKKWGRLSFISQDTDGLNRTISVLVALLSAASIQFAFADGVLTVSGLTAENAAKLIWGAVKMFCLQEVTYRAAVK